MATAMVSALTGRPVDRNLAMTGEISLRGRSLQIGGLKEKVLAAHRGGITHVIIPVSNEKDLPDIPAIVREQLTITPVRHMDEVLESALICSDNEPLFKKREEAVVIDDNTESNSSIPEGIQPSAGG